MDVGWSNWIMGKLAVATPSIKERFFLVQQPSTVNSSSIWYGAWRSSLHIFTGILEGLILRSSQARKKKVEKLWCTLETSDFLWRNRKSKLAWKVIESKHEEKKGNNLPRSVEVCFKAKLQQEGSYDFKWGFKAKDPIQALLLSRFYCDGNDMLCGKWWFSWNGERKKFAVIDVPHEGQTTKSLTCWLSNSV